VITGEIEQGAKRRAKAAARRQLVLYSNISLTRFAHRSKWPTRSDARVSQYASVIRSIGSSRNLPVVDLWSSDDGVPLLDASQDMWDGLHFNAGGNDKLFRKLQLAIRGNFPHLVPEDDEKGIPKMEMHGPYWGTMASVKVDDPGPSLVETWRWNK